MSSEPSLASQDSNGWAGRWVKKEVATTASYGPRWSGDSSRSSAALLRPEGTQIELAALKVDRQGVDVAG